MKPKYLILIIIILGIIAASVYGGIQLIERKAEKRLTEETRVKYQQLISDPKSKYCEVDEDCNIAYPPTECCPCPEAFNKDYAEEINKLPLLCIPPEVVCKECLYDQVCPERECIKCINNSCEIVFPTPAFELLSFKNYPQYSLDTNKIKKLLHGTKCIEFKLVDDKTYEAICSAEYYDPEKQGFHYKFHLKKYNYFQPCIACPPDAYDCLCSCDTAFRSGVVWEIIKRGIMEITTLIEVNSEKVICAYGGL